MDQEELLKDFGVSPYGKIMNAVDLLKELSSEKRVTVFGFFCTHCGDDDPLCQCWNDE